MKWISSEAGHRVLTIFGLKIRVSKLWRYVDTVLARRRQKRAWKESVHLQNSDTLVVFIVPGYALISAGVMSIYSLCRTTRTLLPTATCLLVTEPGALSHAHNDLFRNEEHVFRWGQLMSLLRTWQGKVILHIPEYLAGRFVSCLSGVHRRLLHSLQHLHLNILNQNMQLMPPPEAVRPLSSLSPRVTQTLAFRRNLTQDLADTYGMPVHLFSVRIDISAYPSVPFERKEKIIAYSPDACPEKEQVLKRLCRDLPDYELHLIKGITFNEYMELIARSSFVLTFGEGFDSYFIQPLAVGSVGLAVYNDTFFPSSAWKEFPQVFASWDAFVEQAPSFIRSLAAAPSAYYALITRTNARLAQVYPKDEYMENLRSFYAGRYHLLPGQPNTPSAA